MNGPPLDMPSVRPPNLGDMSNARGREWTWWLYVHWPRLGEGMSGRPAARRCGRDLFCGHHEGQRDHDVGAPGADGASAVGLLHEFAQGVRQSALDPVPDDDAGAERGGGEELLGRGQIGGHVFILGRRILGRRILGAHARRTRPV